MLYFRVVNYERNLLLMDWIYFVRTFFFVDTAAGAPVIRLAIIASTSYYGCIN
jgi:hypothetical protein